MTPKEKAEELLDEFMDYAEFRFNEKNNLSNVHTAKQCALIAVDEILKVAFYANDEIYNFYINVKLEIEKL